MYLFITVFTQEAVSTFPSGYFIATGFAHIVCCHVHSNSGATVTSFGFS